MIFNEVWRSSIIALILSIMTLFNLQRPCPGHLSHTWYVCIYINVVSYVYVLSKEWVLISFSCHFYTTLAYPFQFFISFHCVLNTVDQSSLVKNWILKKKTWNFTKLHSKRISMTNANGGNAKRSFVSFQWYSWIGPNYENSYITILKA